MSRSGECNVAAAAAASVGTSSVVVAISVTSATTAKVVATSVEAVISAAAAASRSSTSSASVHRSRRRTAIHSSIITATTIIAGNVDGHVEVVANLEARLPQRFHVGGVLAAAHCAADLPHAVGVGAAVGEDQCKVESRARLAALLVHLLYQGGELPQRGVHPGVDLHLLRGHFAAGELIQMVVPAVVVNKDAQQKRTFLNWRRRG